MMPVTSRIVECENCMQTLWTDDPDEVEAWKDLEEKDALECPYCGGKMRFVKAREIDMEVER